MRAKETNTGTAIIVDWIGFNPLLVTQHCHDTRDQAAGFDSDKKTLIEKERSLATSMIMDWTGFNPLLVKHH
jgi:hypothetical protein